MPSGQGVSLDQLARQRQQRSQRSADLAELGGTAPDGSARVAQPHHGSGLLGTLGHVVTQTGVDLYDTAIHSPSGLVELATPAVHEFKAIGELAVGNTKAAKKDMQAAHNKGRQLGKAYEGQIKQDVQHPLRHPGNTVLDLAPVASAAARVGLAAGAAADAVSAGDVAGAAKALAKRPDLGPRELKQGDVTLAKGHYSRATGSAVVQKAVDTALQKGAEKSVRAENLLHRRAAKFNERTLTVQDARARAVGTRLAAAGKQLTPAEQRALRLVAEEVPVGRRLAAQQLRQAGAKTTKETAAHQERIDLTRQAMQYLDEGANGKPVFRADATKLKRVYGLLRKTSADRESMLKNLDLMDEASQQAARTKTARIAAGAKFQQDTLGDRLAATPKRFHPHFAENLVGRYVKAADRSNYGRVLSVDPEKGTARLYFKSKEGGRAAVELPLDQLTNPRGRAGKVAGAEDITASPDAVFIGNPVERGRVSGRPKVSSTSTFGHTVKPSSLKTATGGSVEHALERNDVTNIVAERHAEAVRLSQINRRVDLVKKAGDTVPRRNDDVWVWTDKTVSNEKIPPEVRKYLDNPDGLRKLPDHQQQTVLDQIKNAVMERHDWQTDPEARAQFEKLAEQGKGVFVPRRLLGNAAKPSPNVGALPGIKAVDAINNAQKAALVYLKVNYPVVQGLSNTAMGIIHQGFALPANLTKAVRLEHSVGPETAAVIDDIMGQGAVTQAAFSGFHGPLTRASQKLADVMSSKVDRPARRAAFLHEAAKAGFGTPAKLVKLLDDSGNVDKLVEVAQRAKEAIVDYGELSPVERNLVRRIVFVYPWQKGATKYAGNFFRDHPVQAAALGQVGQRGATVDAKNPGPTPSYLNGVVDVGGKLVNPSGVNFFQTPAQIGQAVEGYLSGNKATPGGQDFLAPAPALAVALLTRHDDIGRPLNGNIAQVAEKALAEQTPIVQLAKAAAGHGQTSKTFPNPNDPLWRFLFGGLYPREYSRPALNRNAGLEKSGR